MVTCRIGSRHSLMGGVVYLAICILGLFARLVKTVAVYEVEEYIRIQPELEDVRHKVSNRTVLAYVTPWNSVGMELVDRFEDKFEYVSPVWYTVLVSKSAGKDTSYKLSGGPPSNAEEQWLMAKQRQAKVNEALRTRGDEPRFVVLDYPFPGDKYKKGYSAAMILKTLPGAQDRHIFGFVSAVDTSLGGEPSENRPRIYFHGFSLVKNAPGLKDRWSSLAPRTSAGGEVQKGAVLSLRQLIDVAPGGLRPALHLADVSRRL